MDLLKSFNWLNWYGGKFSTSQRRGVFMDAALEILPADCWRWYLIAQAPESSDTAFTWEQFQAVVNKDLADVLGNFVNRILKFTESKFAGLTPEGGEAGPLETALAERLAAEVETLTQALEAIEIRKAAQTLRQIWVMGNEYLQEAAPWTAIKTDPVRAGVIVRTALGLVSLYARLSAPFIPFASETIAEAVGEGARAGAWATDQLKAEVMAGLEPGRPVKAPEVLFRKIEEAQLEEWRARFGGGDAD